MFYFEKRGQMYQTLTFAKLKTTECAESLSLFWKIDLQIFKDMLTGRILVSLLSPTYTTALAAAWRY